MCFSLTVETKWFHLSYQTPNKFMTQESVVQGKTSHGRHGRDSHFLQIATWWYFVCIKCCGTQHVMHLPGKPWTSRHTSWHINCNIYKTEYPVTVVDAWWMCVEQLLTVWIFQKYLLWHATLQTPEWEAGVWDGICGHLVTLIYQLWWQHHPMQDCHCGSGT